MSGCNICGEKTIPHTGHINDCITRTLDGRSYPMMELWGKSLGSQQRYINDQIRAATERGLPADATYIRFGPRIAKVEYGTITTCTNLQTLHLLAEMANRAKLEQCHYIICHRINQLTKPKDAK